DVALLRVLSMEFWGLSGRDLAALGTFARKYNLHLFEACEVLAEKTMRALPEKPLVTPAAMEQLCKLVDLIRNNLEQARHDTAGQVMFNFLQQSGLLVAILDYRLPLDENKAANITRFFNKLKNFEVDNAEASVEAVVDWLDLSMELGESPLASDSDWMA